MKLLITTIAAVLLVGCGNPEADSALVVACTMSGNLGATKQAIVDGADVNIKVSGNGTRVLHWAAQFSHKEIIEVLLAKGANINAKTTDGLTPLDYTPQSKFMASETADLLRKHGSKTGAELKAEGK
jgi:ankyrin repeat protein